MPSRVLIVEDEPDIRELVVHHLKREGYQVSAASSGEEALRQVQAAPPDLVILDLMMPAMNGLEVCRRLRQDPSTVSLPIVMLTAKGDEVDRVLGLEIGADDYVSKPFSPRELLARIRAVVRRARGQVGPKVKPVRVGFLALDPGARRATVSDREIVLTGYEFSLLYALASRPGRVLSREQLIDLAGGNPDEAFDRSVDVHVSRLRHKLGDDSKNPRMLKTVRGAGYMLATEGE